MFESQWLVLDLTKSSRLLCFLWCILWIHELSQGVSDELAECQKQSWLCCSSINWLRWHFVCTRKHSKVSVWFLELSCNSLPWDDLYHRVQYLYWQSSTVVHCLLSSLHKMIQSHQQQKIGKPMIQELMNMMCILWHHSWLYKIHMSNDRTWFLHTNHRLQCTHQDSHSHKQDWLDVWSKVTIQDSHYFDRKMNTSQSTMKCLGQSCDMCLTEYQKPLSMRMLRWCVKLNLQWQFLKEVSKWYLWQSGLILRESVGWFDPALWCTLWRLELWQWFSDVEQVSCRSQRWQCCLWEWETQWHSECTKKNLKECLELIKRWKCCMWHWQVDWSREECLCWQ